MVDEEADSLTDDDAEVLADTAVVRQRPMVARSTS